MPRIGLPKVPVQAMVPIQQKLFLEEEARRRDLSLSELIRRVLDEAITTEREAR